jgi:putative intracellular protease/amidase
VVVAERIEPMPTDTPLTVIADKTFDEVPDPAVVLVPGGGRPLWLWLHPPTPKSLWASPEPESTSGGNR